MGAVRVLMMILVGGALYSCAPRYVPIHHYHETERIRIERDSLHYIDTVRIAERGDTVRIEVVKWRTRYKIQTDTLTRVDTVQLPAQLTAPREPRRTPRVITILAIIGGVAILAIVAYLAIRITRIVRPF